MYAVWDGTKSRVTAGPGHASSRITFPPVHPRATMRPVELEDLNHEERVALLGLMQKVVAADGKVSDGEREEIAMLVDAFGEDGYREAFDEAAANFGDIESLKRFLTNVGRPEAREEIMGVVLEAAIPGAVEGHESELIEWLGKTWGIETTFEDDDEAE